MKKKVIIGMSGGVDSSVAALLLKDMGYDVIGVTLQLWQEDKEPASESCGLLAVSDAKAVADVIGIPHKVFDFRDIFEEKVVGYFTDEYLKARTPNPCVACNRAVKWEALLEKCEELGADYIATGHYARIEKLENGRYTVKNSITAAKDQTYALCKLTQEQLSKTLMPNGDYTKDQIREIARKAGLPVAEKAESQDICFIPDGDYAAFIKRRTNCRTPEGHFVDLDGDVLGVHKGLLHYTIGQRRGLNLPMGKRVFVKELKVKENQVVVCENEDLFETVVKAASLNFMGIADLEAGEEIRLTGKIRYAHKGTACTVKRTGEDEITCVFDEPVRAVTPGQSLVLYKDDHVAMSGIFL